MLLLFSVLEDQVLKNYLALGNSISHTEQNGSALCFGGLLLGIA